MRGGQQLIPRPADARVGEPAPWATLDASERAVTIDDVRRAFAGRVGEPSGVEGHEQVRASGVLACLWEHDGAVEVLLTRRAMGLRAHSGEVSFPGGRREPGEELVEAALREAHEEVGLDPSSVEILGELDHLMTVTSRSFIVPVVGLLDGRPEGLVPNPGEVDEVRFVPLDELLRDDVFREERWRFAVPPPWVTPEEMEFARRARPDDGGVERPIFFFELVGDTVWGATAAMLRQLLGLVVGIPLGIDHA